MDFNKYLPEYLIVKNVFTFDNCTSHRYFITKRTNLNLKLFADKIKSWHPLVLQDGHNFYYFKGIKKQDFAIASFCLNAETFGLDYSTKILENYFERNSFEI